MREYPIEEGRVMAESELRRRLRLLLRRFNFSDPSRKPQGNEKPVEEATTGHGTTV